MSSLQNSAPGSKSAKFVAANPLAPMANPFSAMEGNEEDEYAKQLSENVNQRLMKAMNEIKQRHANGTQELDDPDRAPTGSAYQYQYQQHQHRIQQQQQQQQQNATTMATAQNTSHNNIQHWNNQMNNNNIKNDDSDDDEWLNGDDDDDAELEAIRQRRLHEMRAMQAKTAQQRALGHGEVRTITQDEFLPECTGSSEWVAVHFFHSEFERCKIMDHHLKLIAPTQLNCKFLRMDADKAPFFVQKLNIKTLPTLMVFREGKAVNRLMGFEGLAPNPNEPDKWHTKRLERWLARTGAIEYKVTTGDEEGEEEVDDKGRRTNVAFRSKGGAVWSGFKGSGNKSSYVEDYDDGDE